MSHSSRQSNNGGGTAAAGENGREPHQHTDKLGEHPATQLEGYSNDAGQFQIAPSDIEGDEPVREWYRIDEEHVFDLEDLK